METKRTGRRNIVEIDHRRVGRRAILGKGCRLVWIDWLAAARVNVGRLHTYESSSLGTKKVPHWLAFWNQSRYDSFFDSDFQSKLLLHCHSLEIHQTTRHIRQFQMDQDNRRRMIQSEWHCHWKNSCFHTSARRGTTIRVLASDCLCGIDSQGISNANLIHADLKIRDALLQQCSSLEYSSFFSLNFVKRAVGDFRLVPSTKTHKDGMINHTLALNINNGRINV
jgi:hypothetical protein